MSSLACQAALAHLKTKKPLGFWSLETKASSSNSNSHLVRLLRRNIPLTDTFYLDIHYDPESDLVVGILSNAIKYMGTAQAQVLVDSTGTPTGNRIQLISISSYSPTRAAAAAATGTTRPAQEAATRRNRRDFSSEPTFTRTVSDEQNREILQYAGMIVGGMILFRILLQSLMGVSLVLVPLGYLYLISTCPGVESFDAKKELKRVLRGYHLPEDVSGESSSCAYLEEEE
jgi:hypothetical protein